MCYRTGEYCNVNTNMFLESFHNQLKNIYLDGKRNRRIDVLLETLLHIENNLFFKHFTKKTYNLPSNEDVKVTDRHENSLSIDDSAVSQVNENTFIIASNNNIYTVTIHHQTCPETHCFIKCKKIPCVNLCRHLLTCSCPDFVQGNLCKHTHKVFCGINKHTESKQDHVISMVRNFDKDVKSNNTGTCGSNNAQSKQAKVNEIQEKLKVIAEQVQNNNAVQDHRLDNILLALNHIISGNEGCRKISQSFEKFSQSEKISSNANNIKQPRFRSTSKKPGRKCKTVLRKPSEIEQKKLLNNFQQDKENISPVPNPQPSVAPYPPLRLERQTHPTLTLPVRTSEPLINVFQPDSLTSSYRVPPSLYGRRITIVHNGKKQEIVFMPGNKNSDNEDP